MPDNAVTIVAAGAPLREARGVVVMLHGRGATAEDILSLNDELGQDVAYLAPQAPSAGGTGRSRFRAAVIHPGHLPRTGPKFV
jgi:predicted esterase